MIENELTALIQTKFGKSLQDAGDQELYYALLAYTKEKLKETPDITGKKKLYYISRRNQERGRKYYSSI